MRRFSPNRMRICVADSKRRETALMESLSYVTERSLETTVCGEPLVPVRTLSARCFTAISASDAISPQVAGSGVVERSPLADLLDRRSSCRQGSRANWPGVSVGAVRLPRCFTGLALRARCEQNVRRLLRDCDDGGVGVCREQSKASPTHRLHATL